MIRASLSSVFWSTTMISHPMPPTWFARDTKKRLSSSVRPRVQRINENIPSVGALTIPFPQTLSEEEDATAKGSRNGWLASVFKRIKSRLYFFTSDAILLIPGNRIGVKCARHPFER
jgi:hypothetical protein